MTTTIGLKRFGRRVLRLGLLIFLGIANLSMTGETPDWFLTDVDRTMEENQGWNIRNHKSR